MAYIPNEKGTGSSAAGKGGSSFWDDRNARLANGTRAGEMAANGNQVPGGVLSRSVAAATAPQGGNVDPNPTGGSINMDNPIWAGMVDQTPDQMNPIPEENPYPRNRFSGYDYNGGSPNYSGIYGGRGGRTPASGSSIGGVSAVNPQSEFDMQGYIDQSYDAVKNRLDPIFDQRQDDFDQSMVNRGIPVGSEAYNKALRQMDQNENDAYQQAAFEAMGFGAGLQDQDFRQDATRSSLANALLQSKWSSDLGWGNLGLGYDNLNERGRQFNENMGYNYNNLNERGRQFDETMDFGYFNADRDDMRWLNEFDRMLTNDQTSNNRWSDQMTQWMLQPWQQNQVNVNPLNSQYSNQWWQYNAQNQNSNDWWNSLAQYFSDNWGS